MPRNTMEEPSALDAFEAIVVERSVFGMGGTGHARRVQTRAPGSPSASEDPVQNAPEARVSPNAPEAKAADLPEASRLFAAPTHKEAAHALRELGWGEHLVCKRMASARGATDVYVYSLRDAAVLLLDDSSGRMSISSSRSFVWVDIGELLRWLQDVVGDAAFAGALETRLAGRATYNDRLEVLRMVFSLRMSQYAPYIKEEAQEAQPPDPGTLPRG